MVEGVDPTSLSICLDDGDCLFSYFDLLARGQSRFSIVRKASDSGVRRHLLVLLHEVAHDRSAQNSKVGDLEQIQRRTSGRWAHAL